MKKILLLALFIGCSNPTDKGSNQLDLPELRNTCNDWIMSYELFDLNGNVDSLLLITHKNNGMYLTSICTTMYLFDQNQNLIKYGNRILTYNIANKIGALKILDSNGNTEHIYYYNYDLNSNIESISDENGKKLTTYSYSKTNDYIISNQLDETNNYQSIVIYYDHYGTCLKIEWPSLVKYFNKFGKVIKDSLVSSLQYSTYIYTDDNLLDTIYNTTNSSASIKKHQYFDFDSLNNYRKCIIIEFDASSLATISIDTINRYVTYH